MKKIILFFASFFPFVCFTQTITTISETTLSKSGMLKITGVDFGTVKGTGIVKIDGAVAPVSRWSANSITAYIPETVSTGRVKVEVITSNGISNALFINVTERTEAGGVKWRFKADDLYIAGRPAVGPDSTIYALGINGHLYALTPDGGLKWIFTGFGSTQSVSVGKDGTIYFAGLNVIYAINPNGTLKWTVADPSGQAVDVGPNVGPDGNIYAVTDEAGLGGLGAVSISPAGNILWNRPGFLHAYGTAFATKEVVFSAGQLYFCMNHISAKSGLQALTLSGDQRWTKPAEGQPAVAPDGRIYAITAQLINSYAELSAFTPQGNLIRKYFGNETRGLTAPDVGPDGVFYIGQDFLDLVAMNPNGVQKWKVAGRGILGGPIVSPTNNQVAVGGYEIGKPGYVAGVSTKGQVKWIVSLPRENGGYVRPMSRPRFSLDGSAVYVGMDVNDYAPDPYTYLYAFNTGTKAATVTVSDVLQKNINNVEISQVKDDLKVYPNPVKDILNINTNKKITVSLADLSGKILLVTTIHGNTTVNISKIPHGVYLLKNLSSGSTQKVIKN